MIATHNVKVNGKWYRAGEEIGEKKAVKAEVLTQEVIPEEEMPEEPKPVTRRKKTTK